MSVCVFFFLFCHRIRCLFIRVTLARKAETMKRRRGKKEDRTSQKLN